MPLLSGHFNADGVQREDCIDDINDWAWCKEGKLTTSRFTKDAGWWQPLHVNSMADLTNSRRLYVLS